MLTEAMGMKENIRERSHNTEVLLHPESEKYGKVDFFEVK
jgi:hypothetical protein